MNLPPERIPNTFELTIADCALERQYEAFDLNAQALEIRTFGLPEEPRSLGRLILGWLPCMLAGINGYRGYSPFPKATTVADIDRKIQELERRARMQAPDLFYGR